jgi:hypothetical protein
VGGSATGVALELGFAYDGLELFGIGFIETIRQQKAQVLDMFVTFTLVVVTGFLVAHHETPYIKCFESIRFFTIRASYHGMHGSTRKYFLATN